MVLVKAFRVLKSFTFLYQRTGLDRLGIVSVSFVLPPYLPLPVLLFKLISLFFFDFLSLLTLNSSTRLFFSKDEIVESICLTKIPIGAVSVYVLSFFTELSVYLSLVRYSYEVPFTIKFLLHLSFPSSSIVSIECSSQ